MADRDDNGRDRREIQRLTEGLQHFSKVFADQNYQLERQLDEEIEEHTKLRGMIEILERRVESVGSSRAGRNVISAGSAEVHARPSDSTEMHPLGT